MMPEPLVDETTRRRAARGLIKKNDPHGKHAKLEEAKLAGEVEGYIPELPTYQEVLTHAQKNAARQPPVVPIHMDYQDIVHYRCGHAALEPFAGVPMHEFQNNMMS